MGQSVLGSIGCDNRTILRAAVERSGENFEKDNKLAGGGSCEKSEGVDAALFGESMFHKIFTADDVDLSDE